MTAPLLELRGVTKSYGPIKALRGIDLAVPPGGVFGLVGPNGAGKTTLFSVLCGFLGADSGTVTFLGQPVSPATPPARGRLSLLPQDAAFMSHIPVAALLTYYARLGGFDKRAARDEAHRVLSLVGLSEMAGRPAEHLSHGQRKRVGIAQAFLGEPAVIILDEPTAGLDPHASREIRAVIRQLRSDQTVIVSSHNLLEVEDLCTEVAILNKGVVARHDTIASLIGSAAEVSFRMAAAPAEPVVAALRALPWVTHVAWDHEAARMRVSFDAAQMPSDKASGALVNTLVQSGGAFLDMQVGKSLEDRFVEETR